MNDKLEKKISEILPKQKPTNNASFLERNRRLIIIISSILIILWIFVMLYMKFAVTNLYEKVISSSGY